MTNFVKMSIIQPNLENTITHTYGAIENVDCEEIYEEKKLKNVTPKKYVQLTFNFEGEQT